MTSSSGVEFGGLLRRLRLAAGLSQEALAERAGLSVGAIAAHERGRRRHPRPFTISVLADALRLEPASRAALVEAGAQATAPPTAEPEAAAAHPPPPVRTVPAQLTSFVGRKQEMARGRHLMRECRLLMLTGPGGVGKTRLAIRLADELRGEFPDGVWFADLAELAEPSQVQLAIGDAVGVREESGENVLDALVDALASRQTLGVIDNCEHLLDACAATIVRLLTDCPHLRLIATSRQLLGVPGEQIMQVRGLPVPPVRPRPRADLLLPCDSVQLLVERAKLGDRPLLLTDGSAGAVAELCRRLDGIPLALELAAARLRHMTLEQVLARLSDRLRLLVGGPAAAAARHQTLQATLDWSYDLLDQREQRAFRHLGVFPGSFDVEAGQAVCEESTSAGAADTIAGLVDRSLVLVEPSGRFRLLETFREYARRRLDDAGELAAARQRHAAHFTHLAAIAAPGLRGQDQAHWMRRIEEELPNVRDALAWCIEVGEPAGLAMAEQTTRFWLARGHISEGRQWLERVLLIPTTDPALRARVLRSAGHLEYWQEQYDQARNHLTESLAIAREMGDQTGAARRLVLLALVAEAQDDHTTARDLLIEAERIFTQAGDRPGLVNAWISLAMNPHVHAEADEAERTAINAFELARTLGDWGRMLEALMIRQAIAIERRDAETARPLLLEGLQIARDTANVAHFTVSIWLVMELAWLRGQPDWVVRLAATERSMRSVTGASLVAPSRRQREGLLDRARLKVGARRASALWHEGLKLTMDDVISYVDGNRVLSVPGGLSSRELEVARLVAAGLTDKEIGRTLNVTARTAETHLANIRNKLGLRSRSEVAAWVAEQLAPADT